MPHNPNPFDFVPFAQEPKLLRPEDFDKMGKKISGYLDVRIHALTPIHVVGTYERGQGESHSAMYRQDGSPMIPAASIRGMLRAFMEALTSGWISQATETYPKIYGSRHLGFSLFDDYVDDKNRHVPPAVGAEFRPTRRPDGQVDLATYLFGIVTEPRRGDEPPLTMKSKVWIEDALVPEEALVTGKYWTPDIDSDAFMGGPKPSRSNWWYFYPHQIWLRKTEGHELAEFVGEKLRGRKFYFHQPPEGTMRFYDKNGAWPYSRKRPFHRVWLESMERGTSTHPFRIYFDGVPIYLAALFVLMLMPGPTIRHKIGFGKAYGYGSMALEVLDVFMRYDIPGSLPAELQPFNLILKGWDRELLDRYHLSWFIDWRALTWLARILGWQEDRSLLCTYPPFARHGFMQPVTWEDLKTLAPRDIVVRSPMTVTSREARKIAEALFEIKKPIHFRYYQEQANGWEIIKARKP